MQLFREFTVKKVHVWIIMLIVSLKIDTPNLLDGLEGYFILEQINF